MPDFEGSVDYEGDSEESTNENNENVNNQEEETTETETKEVTNNQGKESEESSQNQEKTDKGTKLDPDPLSQANQLRANAERKLRNYEALLTNPAALKKYAAQFETDEPKDKQEEVEEIDPSKIETTEDLQKYAKSLEAKTRKEIEAIKKGIEQDKQANQVKETGQRIASEIDSVQNKYPQLREFNADGTKNPDFDSELDNKIGEFYNELDFDSQSQQYRGKVSFSKVAEAFMDIARKGEASGSRKAQTIVKDKRLGRAQSGTVDKSAPDETTMSASQLIASRMRRVSGK